ncbi:MAG: lipoyl(octanoyl) transferase LipB [Candidatus Omnitrophota bacterium]
MKCHLIDLGLVDFLCAYHFQKEIIQKVLQDRNSRLLFCEHPAVFTMGRIADEKFLLADRKDLSWRKIDVLRIDRGGEVTFHGPGQIVIYPIFNLEHSAKDLKIFLQKLEEVLIDLLKYFGIVANRQKGYTGVWVNEKKIASIGIGVKKWISYHGIGLNVNTDLSFFSMIKPCGLDVAMTSMAQELGQAIDQGQVKEKLIESFIKEFKLEILN